MECLGHGNNGWAIGVVRRRRINASAARRKYEIRIGAAAAAPRRQVGDKRGPRSSPRRRARAPLVVLLDPSSSRHRPYAEGRSRYMDPVEGGWWWRATPRTGFYGDSMTRSISSAYGADHV